MNQILTVNLHRPQVQNFSVLPSGGVVVELGNGKQNGLVDVFFEDLFALQAFVTSLEDKVVEIRDAGMVQPEGVVVS